MPPLNLLSTQTINYSESKNNIVEDREITMYKIN